MYCINLKDFPYIIIIIFLQVFYPYVEHFSEPKDWSCQSQILGKLCQISPFVLCRGKKIIIGLEQHVGEEITAFEFFEFVWRVI